MRKWKVKVHGKGRPRKWIKLHVAIDESTQEIVGEISTEGTVDDGKAFPHLFSQVSGHIKTIIGDGSYDDQDIRSLIRKRGGKALVPFAEQCSMPWYRPRSGSCCFRYSSFRW